MIIKSLRENCPTCPLNITFFENETPIFDLDLHRGEECGDCYIVRWRIKEEIPLSEMYHYEENIIASYYADVFPEYVPTRKPRRVQAEYDYGVEIEGRKCCQSKQITFFLLFGRSIEDALDQWDSMIQAAHAAFVESNESRIAFADHSVDGQMAFNLQIYSRSNSEFGNFKEICFIVRNHYFPRKFFTTLLRDTCTVPLSQESAEEIVQLAEAEQRLCFNAVA
ncbi:MAG: hypothetical protein U1A25_01435 [Candidatus Sungbacteria bacterium]|nr:hypothetical protein [bacterium]MDZ4260303.1 hypothetical protein [Candidatus Sungbacteria bacterium]